MRVNFKKSNRKYKWTTPFYHLSYKDDVYNAINTLNKLYPTAIVQYRLKNKMFRKFKIVITFVDISDEAHFLLLGSGGLEL